MRAARNFYLTINFDLMIHFDFWNRLCYQGKIRFMEVW